MANSPDTNTRRPLHKPKRSPRRMKQNALFTSVLLVLALAAAALDESADNYGAPEFSEEVFKGCAPSAGEKENINGYYVCRDDHSAKLMKLFGANNYRPLDTFEQCYALGMAKKLKMAEPHSIEAFEKKYGLVEILMRSYKCKQPNGPSDPNVITNTQKLEMIKETAWALCQAELSSEEFEDMKAFYVCRNYQKTQELAEYFNYMTGNRGKAQPFEDCFVEATAEVLDITPAQFRQKYDIAMLVKSLKCSRIPPVKKETEWKEHTSWLVKLSNGAFTKIAAAASKFLSEDKWKCLQRDVPPQSTTIGSIACSDDVRAKLSACVSDPSKQAATVPAEGRLKKMLDTISKFFGKLTGRICGKETGKGVSAIRSVTILELGDLLAGKARNKRSEGYEQHPRMKRAAPNDATVLSYIMSLMFFALPSSVVSGIIIIFITGASATHPLLWFYSIAFIVDVLIVSQV